MDWKETKKELPIDGSDVITYVIDEDENYCDVAIFKDGIFINNADLANYREKRYWAYIELPKQIEVE